MAGMMQQLLEVMNEQAQRYEELHGLSLEKRDVLVKNDVEELQKITNLENLVVSQNNRLEKKRLSLVQDIAEVLGHGSNDMDLATLIGLMEGKPEQEELRAIGNRIRETLNKLKDVNTLNGELLESSLEYIEYSMNLMRSSMQQGVPTYSLKDGQITEDFSVFDAKK
jgi:flagellar biosynthesis/type III secretory pathway chaperone